MKKLLLIACLFLGGCTSAELQRIGKSVLVDAVKTGVNQEIRNKVGVDVTCKQKDRKTVNCKRH